MDARFERVSGPRRLALISLCSAMAIVTGAAESLFPLPFPGMRLGIANVFNLLALILSGPGSSVSVAVLRLFLLFFLSGNMFSLTCGAAGLLLSLPVTIVLYERHNTALSIPAISTASAFAFNIGQVAAAIILTGEPAIASYLPLLLAAAVITGLAVGRLAETLARRLRYLLGRD
ncbi:MAG: Gx transporter family protein [Synergistaceae bacterium]|jgi:heptaprenyl diphosphate synthase|nr:Gx transporter family protein [Synergistaceae bacterium]